MPCSAIAPLGLTIEGLNQNVKNATLKTYRVYVFFPQKYTSVKDLLSRTKAGRDVLYAINNRKEWKRVHRLHLVNAVVKELIDHHGTL